MNGLIVLEGADGVGKTTLAKYFVDKHDAHYMHLTYRYKNAMFTYHAAALHRACKLSAEKLVVLDRSWISEGLYAEAYRGGSPWPHMGRVLDRLVQKHAGVYILALPDGTTDDHEKKFQTLRSKREEMFSTAKPVTELYNRFALGDSSFPGQGYCRDVAKTGFLKRGDVIAYRIALEGSNLQAFAAGVLNTIWLHQIAQYPYALDPYDYNFLGHAQTGRCKYVFIGDCINPERRQAHYPFFAHVNSSLFLSRALSAIRFDERQAVYTNVNDENGVRNVLAMINDRWMIPVCMGWNSTKTIKLSNYRFVAHPSYGRRFMGLEKYIQQLREAIDAQDITSGNNDQAVESQTGRDNGSRPDSLPEGEGDEGDYREPIHD